MALDFPLGLAALRQLLILHVSPRLEFSSCFDSTPGMRLLTKTLFFGSVLLGQVPGGAPFSQRSELATACTSRMQIKEPYKTN